MQAQLLLMVLQVPRCYILALLITLPLMDVLEELEDVRSVTANLEAEESLLEAVLGHPQS